MAPKDGFDLSLEYLPGHATLLDQLIDHGLE